MDRRALAFTSIGIVLLAALPARAAELAVEEFATVTRVTIPALDGGEWIVNESVRAFDMRTGAVDLGMTVPTLPGGSRLAALEVWEGNGNTGISIRFTCTCTTTHFRGEAGVVIVDISEAPPPDPVQAEAVEPPGPDTPAKAVKSDEEPEEPPQEPDEPHKTVELAGPAGPVDPPEPEEPEESVRDAPPAPAPTTRRKRASPGAETAEKAPRSSLPPETKPVAVVQARFTEVVRARTAPARPARPAPGDEAILRAPLPRAKPANRRPRPSAPQGEDAAIDALRAVVLSKLAAGVEEGRITMESGKGAASAYVPAGCPDEAALDLKRLTGSDGFREALPALRADVYDEMKQVNPAAVRMLARHFLAFGLGEEARNVIAAFDGEGPAEKLIVEMATVLEGNGKTMSSGLLIKPGCGPRAAVWRAMVAAESRTGTVGAIYDEARNTVLDLPDPLRKILGARIALGLIDEGDRESAMRLWRNMERATGPRTPELDLLEAHTDEGRQLDTLLAIARSRSPLAGEAAMRAADMLLLNEDRARAEHLGATLEDLIFIHRGTATETSLSLALAQLQARYGNLAAALTALAKKADDQPERAEHWRSIARETIRVATESADPVARPRDFDTILASLEYLDDSPSSDGAKFSLVRKLMSVGGAHIVESVLTPAIRRRAPEARRLLAEAKLLMGDAAGARRLLAGLEDEDSEALQARTATLSASGSAETARDRFAPVGEIPRAATISGARALMEKAEEDLSIIEELLADG